MASSRAHFQGSGSLNGDPGDGFLVTAVDGDGHPLERPDKFRIKIWERETQQVIYDNQMGESDDSDAALEIKGGEIVVSRG